MTQVPSYLFSVSNEPCRRLGQALVASVSVAFLAGVAHAQEAISEGLREDESTGVIGEFTYFADAAVFRDCLNDERYPVAMEREYITLERAYLDQVVEAGEPLIAVLDGSLQQREGMEGGQAPHVVVDRVAGLVPGLTCERAMADATLENTYWRVVSLEGEVLITEEGQKEAGITFHTEGERSSYSATAGCNQILGSYEADLPDLKLSPGAMTQMACPPPLDLRERQFTSALAATVSARIIGPTLEFYDAEAVPIMFLEAVDLP